MRLISSRTQSPQWLTHARQRLRCCAIAIAFLLLFTTGSSAQTYYADQPLPDSAATLKKVYGLNDTTFAIIGEFGRLYRNEEISPGNFVDLDPVSNIWKWARRLGIKIVAQRNGDTSSNDVGLMDSTHLTEGEHLMMFVQYGEGWGRDLVFYPHDEIESYYWQNKFLYRSGGGPGS